MNCQRLEMALPGLSPVLAPDWADSDAAAPDFQPGPANCFDAFTKFAQRARQYRFNKNKSNDPAPLEISVNGGRLFEDGRHQCSDGVF